MNDYAAVSPRKTLYFRSDDSSPKYGSVVELEGIAYLMPHEALIPGPTKGTVAPTRIIDLSHVQHAPSPSHRADCDLIICETLDRHLFEAQGPRVIENPRVFCYLNQILGRAA